MNRIEYNVETGEQVIVPLTDAEIAEIQEASANVPRYIPQEVTRFQALAALHLAGLLAMVEAMMADPATDPLTVLAWKNAQEFKRYSPMVLNMAQAIGLSDHQVDDLFITAAQIE